MSNIENVIESVVSELVSNPSGKEATLTLPIGTMSANGRFMPVRGSELTEAGKVLNLTATPGNSVRKQVETRLIEEIQSAVIDSVQNSEVYKAVEKYRAENLAEVQRQQEAKTNAVRQQANTIAYAANMDSARCIFESLGAEASETAIVAGFGEEIYQDLVREEEAEIHADMVRAEAESAES